MSIAPPNGQGFPKGMDPKVVAKLQDAFTKAGKEQKFQDLLKANSMIYDPLTGEQFAQFQD